MGLSKTAAELICKTALAQCCAPPPIHPPPLDPPAPTDYEAGGMKRPTEYGIPTPLVGGCNCDHSDFGEETFDGFEMTGNVSTYRP